MISRGETLRWQRWTDIVANIDIFFSTFVLVRTMWVANDVLFITEAHNQQKIFAGHHVAIIWVLLIFFGTWSLVGLWAAVKLLYASDLRGELRDNLRKARFWRLFNIPFFILVVLINFPTARYISLALTTLIKGPSILVVWAFINELEFVELNPPPAPAPPRASSGYIAEV